MIIPETLIYKIAHIFGIIAFHVVRIRRDVTIKNLQNAFPELSCPEILSLAKRSYINISYSFIEMLMINRFKNELCDRVQIEGMEHIKKRAEKGEGVIVVSCHYGNWEIMGASFVAYGFPMTAMAKRQSNPYVNNFINTKRNTFGIKVISHGINVRQIIEAIRNSENIALISDQDAGKKGTFISFFGKPSSTVSGAAQLALKYNTPIIIAMIYRLRPGYYRLVIKDVPIFQDDTLVQIIQRYTSLMEEMIREQPEQYFWMHRRWKTQPQKNTRNNTTA